MESTNTLIIVFGILIALSAYVLFSGLLISVWRRKKSSENSIADISVAEKEFITNKPKALYFFAWLALLAVSLIFLNVYVTAHNNKSIILQYSDSLLKVKLTPPIIIHNASPGNDSFNLIWYENLLDQNRKLQRQIDSATALLNAKIEEYKKAPKSSNWFLWGLCVVVIITLVIYSFLLWGKNSKLAVTSAITASILTGLTLVKFEKGEFNFDHFLDFRKNKFYYACCDSLQKFEHKNNKVIVDTAIVISPFIVRLDSLSLGNQQKALKKLDSLFDFDKRDLKSIFIYGSADARTLNPTSPFRDNMILAGKRAEWMKRFLIKNYPRQATNIHCIPLGLYKVADGYKPEDHDGNRCVVIECEFEIFR